MSRCAVCDHSCKVVLPSGPSGAELLMIGEKPGRQEANYGRPFIGDAGKELDQTYLYRAGVPRSKVRITNTVKCRLGDNNNKPTQAQIEGCGKHWLPKEVSTLQPKVIFLLGSTACSLVPKIELDKQHGFPVWCEEADSEYFGGWEGWVVPMYHPAAGMHNTSLMTPLLQDFERMGKWFRGRWEPPKRDQGKTDYKLIETPFQLDRYIDQYDNFPNRISAGCDTENDGSVPWSIQISLAPLTGRMILANNTKVIARLAEWIGDSPNVQWYMHHELHDLEVCEKLGVRFNRPVYDTMQEAYHLGDLPQKLKHLAWRLLGVQMRDWDEVVGPPSRKLMVQWMHKAWIWAQDSPVKVEKQLKTKVRVEWKPNEQDKALKRILSHSHKPTYDIWKKCREAGLLADNRLIGEVGRNPIMSIANAPLEEAVVYGCEDAAVTLEVGMELGERRKRLVEEEKGEWWVGEVD